MAGAPGGSGPPPPLTFLGFVAGSQCLAGSRRRLVSQWRQGPGIVVGVDNIVPMMMHMMMPRTKEEETR